MDEEPRAVTQYGGPPEFRVPGDPQLTAEQSGSDEDDLRAGLSGLAGLVAGARGVNELLTEVAQFAAQAIPGVEGLGATVIQPSDGKLQIQAWEVTAAFVREIDILQYEVLNEGPCQRSFGNPAARTGFLRVGGQELFGLGARRLVVRGVAGHWES